MDAILTITVLILSVAIVTLLIIFLRYQKKSIFIPDTDKEFIDFTIEMYIKYAEKLDIHSPQQHKKIVEKLEKIRIKYFVSDEKKIK